MSEQRQPEGPISTPPAIESLQFDKAEIPDNSPKCSICSKPIDTYYRLGANKICTECAESVRAGQQRPAHHMVVRGALFGTGAAILCCIGYALIVWITSYELALIAILVGQLIGSAVRRGSAGLGGRRLQILAVALTYVAITFSYIPLLIKGVSEASKQRMEKSAKQESTKSEKSPQEVAPFGPVQIVLTLLFLGGLALFVPFLQLEDPLNGLLGLGIIFFGLQRAWSLTARSDAELHGPFSDQPSEAHA